MTDSLTSPAKCNISICVDSAKNQHYAIRIDENALHMHIDIIVNDAGHLLSYLEKVRRMYLHVHYDMKVSFVWKGVIVNRDIMYKAESLLKNIYASIDTMHIGNGFYKTSEIDSATSEWRNIRETLSQSPPSEEPLARPTRRDSWNDAGTIGRKTAPYFPSLPEEHQAGPVKYMTPMEAYKAASENKPVLLPPAAIRGNKGHDDTIIKMIVNVIKKKIDTCGAAPDFSDLSSEKKCNKIHNYIKSVSARPHLDRETAMRVAEMIAMESNV